MQATVHRFDVDGSGSVLTDSGVVLPFAAQAFSASGLRHLRPGQRLTVEVIGEGAQAVVSALRLETVAVVPSRPARP